jgi:hypothetical protein
LPTFRWFILVIIYFYVTKIYNGNSLLLLKLTSLLMTLLWLLFVGKNLNINKNKIICSLKFGFFHKAALNGIQGRRFPTPGLCIYISSRKIFGSSSGGYEEFYLLRYNSVYSVESLHHQGRRISQTGNQHEAGVIFQKNKLVMFVQVSDLVGYFLISRNLYINLCFSY